MQTPRAASAFVAAGPLTPPSPLAPPRRRRVSQPCCAVQPPPDHAPPSISRRAFLSRLLNAAVFVSAPSVYAQDATTSESSPSPAPPPSQPRPQPKPPTRPRRPTWGYSPENGPSAWASLSEDWALASSGKLQSPIPLSYRTALSQPDVERPQLITNPAKFTVRLRELPAAANPSLFLEQYVPPPPPLVGDAPPVDTYTPPPIPALVVIPDGTYAFRCMYFHASSSEHVIEGVAGPMEVHLLFERRMRGPPPAAAAEAPPPPDDDQPLDPDAEKPAPPQTLVVAMLASQAETSAPWLSSVLQKFQSAAGDDGKGPGIVMDIDLSEVLPPFDSCDLYSYTGSLTTPPCAEGVQWIVVSDRMAVSEADVGALTNLQGGANVRPLQETNGRRVIRFPAVDSSQPSAQT